MSVTTVGLDALLRAQERLRTAAENIARSEHLTEKGSPDTVDLSADVVQLIEAGLQHAVAVQVMETQEDIQQKLLDVLG